MIEIDLIYLTISEFSEANPVYTEVKIFVINLIATVIKKI